MSPSATSKPTADLCSVANGNGSTYANFTFQVKDDGGTANNGVDVDPTPNTIVFTVNSVNDAPTAVGRPIVLPVSTSYAFTTTDFGFADPSDVTTAAPNGNAFFAVTIVSLPTRGTLTLNGNPVVAGQSIRRSTSTAAT